MTDQAVFFYTLSEKGRDKLNYDGHVYNYDKNAKSGGVVCGTLWKCESKTSRRCPGRARLQNDCVTISTPHNHEALVMNEEISRYRSYIKQKFEETLEPAHIIMSNASEILSKTATVKLPPIHHTKRRGQRIRAKANGTLPEPKDRASVPNIPEKFQVTKRNEAILQYDSGPESGNNRMLLFSSNEGIMTIKDCHHLVGDGTFRAAPEVFYQLYVIGAYIRGYIFPCVYALLPNKKEETYTRLFNQISTITEDVMYPYTFMI